MSDKLRIAFARHSTYDYQANISHDKSPLNPRGVELATRLAAELKDAGFGGEETLIISSPIIRARQTAEIIAGEITSHHKTHRFLELGSFDARGPHDRELLESWNYSYGDFVTIFSEQYKNVVVVTHQPNVAAFSAMFAAASKRFYVPDYCGSVGFQIESPSWREITEQERASAKLLFANRAESLKLGN